MDSSTSVMNMTTVALPTTTDKGPDKIVIGATVAAVCVVLYVVFGIVLCLYKKRKANQRLRDYSTEGFSKLPLVEFSLSRPPDGLGEKASAKEQHDEKENRSADFLTESCRQGLVANTLKCLGMGAEKSADHSLAYRSYFSLESQGDHFSWYGTKQKYIRRSIMDSPRDSVEMKAVTAEGAFLKKTNEKTSRLKQTSIQEGDSIYYMSDMNIWLSLPPFTELTELKLMSQPFKWKKTFLKPMTDVYTFLPHGKVFSDYLLFCLPISTDILESGPVELIYSCTDVGEEPEWISLKPFISEMVHQDDIFWILNEDSCFLFTKHFCHVFFTTFSGLVQQPALYLMASVHYVYTEELSQIKFNVGFHCSQCYPGLLESSENLGKLLGSCWKCIYGKGAEVVIQVNINENDWKCVYSEGNIDDVTGLLHLCKLDKIFPPVMFTFTKQANDDDGQCNLYHALVTLHQGNRTSHIKDSLEVKNCVQAKQKYVSSKHPTEGTDAVEHYQPSEVENMHQNASGGHIPMEHGDKPKIKEVQELQQGVRACVSETEVKSVAETSMMANPIVFETDRTQRIGTENITDTSNNYPEQNLVEPSTEYSLTSFPQNDTQSEYVAEMTKCEEQDASSGNGTKSENNGQTQTSTGGIDSETEVKEATTSPSASCSWVSETPLKSSVNVGEGPVAQWPQGEIKLKERSEFQPDDGASMSETGVKSVVGTLQMQDIQGETAKQCQAERVDAAVIFSSLLKEEEKHLCELLDLNPTNLINILHQQGFNIAHLSQKNTTGKVFLRIWKVLVMQKRATWPKLHERLLKARMSEAAHALKDVYQKKITIKSKETHL